MYIPARTKLDEAIALDWIAANRFAVLMGPTLEATHLPFILDRQQSPPRLRWHMARANPHAGRLHGADVLVVFAGPHHYVSPRWYESRPAVPTWNYLAVHVRGNAVEVHGDAHVSIIEELVELEDPGLDREQILTEDVFARLLPATRAFELEVTSIEAKAKLGQHRDSSDQQGVVAGLKDLDRPQAQSLLDLMCDLELGDGHGHDDPA